MLRKFEHVGMTVAQMDRTLAFYVDLLGLRLVVRRGGAGSDEIAFLDAGGEVAFCRDPDGILVELVEH